MINKLMKGLVRAELQAQQRSGIKIMLLVYGALAAAAGLFGVGAAIKNFVDRVDNIDKKLSKVDRPLLQEERRLAQEKAVAEAYALLMQIENAKVTVAEHEAQARQSNAEIEAVRELGRKRVAHTAQ